MKHPHVLLPTLVMLGVLLSACSANPSGASGQAAKASWDQCTGFIQSKLGIASTEAPGYNASSVSSLPQGQFVVTLYYDKTSTLYRCDMKQGSDGSWKLTKLDSMLPNEASIWNIKR